MNKESMGMLLAVVTAIFSGIAIPANKVFIVSLDPVIFTAIRSIIIGAVFFLLSQWQFNKSGNGVSRNKKGKKFIVSWKYLAIIAVVGGAAAFLLFFTGLKLTTAGRAAFLHKTLPLYTALLAFVFLKEKMTKRYLGAMLLMFVGTMAIYWTSISSNPLWINPQLGDLLIIAAAFLWAVENVVAKKAMTGGETNFVVSFARMFFGGLVLLGVALLMGKTSALMTLSSGQWISISISTVLLLCYVLFYYWSISLINVSKAAAVLLLAPVVSLVIGITFLGEPAPFTQLAGSAFILVGAYLIANVRSEQKGI